MEKIPMEEFFNEHIESKLLMNKKETEECENWIDFIRESVINMYKKQKEIAAHALIFAHKDSLHNKPGIQIDENSRGFDDEHPFGFMHMPMGPMMETETSKDIASDLLRKVINDVNAYAYVFISEAYVSKNFDPKDMNPDGTVDHDKRPLNLPDDQRTEIVMVCFETKDWQGMETYEIVREDKEPWLYKMKNLCWDTRIEKKNKAGSEGRFSGFIYKSPKYTAQRVGVIIQDILKKIKPDNNE